VVVNLAKGFFVEGREVLYLLPPAQYSIKKLLELRDLL
jgi:hypothetical protein